MRQFCIFAGALAFFASTSAGLAAETAACTNPNALGVSRTVEIDTTGGPGFGFEHYKAYDFLQSKEVVLTFDDGPQKFSTEMILTALADQCVKATFFSVGKMALGYPEIIRAVAKGGHTVGTHTWSHKVVSSFKTFADAKDEIERGVSAVKRAVGGPVAPFFRFPTLKDSPEALAHLSSRNIAMFSTDIDSFDFKPQPPEKIVKTIIDKLERNGKGIVLLHDIHKTTAKSVPLLLTALKDKGYKIVHLKAKAPSVVTLAEFDQAIEKDAKGLPQAGNDKPVSSIIRTVEGAPTAEEAAATTQKVEAPVTETKTEAKVATESTPAPAVAKAPEQPATATATEPAPASTTPVAATPEPNTSSITTGSVQPTSAEPNAGPVKTVGNVGDESASIPDAPKSSSFSDKAREFWELWFGK